VARKIETVSELSSLVGKDLGTSGWYDITQHRVDLFADATEDHQWIHVDPRRAETESPFGGPIAHGYLTLSLLSTMTLQVLTVERMSMGVNYGLNKVRFPAPVPVGSRVRLAASVVTVEEFDGGAQIVLAATVECDQTKKLVCVAEPVYRYYH
jgi:acyl dehydratase